MLDPFGYFSYLSVLFYAYINTDFNGTVDIFDFNAFKSIFAFDKAFKVNGFF